MGMTSQPPDDMPALLRAAAAQPGPAGPDCLDEETIAAVVDGAMDAVARTAATRHLASCARCRRAVASVLHGVADTTVTHEIAAIDRAGGRRFARFVLPAAAAAALILFLVRPHAADDSATDHRGPTVTSAAAPVPLAPVAAVAEAHVLRWSAVPGADRYRVTLFDSGGRVRYETQLADTAVSLPDSVTFVPGQSYLWNVEARIGWDRWSSSPLTQFSIMEAPRR
jgi:anti-sigma factor ChrR (cupin superfamily)